MKRLPFCSIAICSFAFLLLSINFYVSKQDLKQIVESIQSEVIMIPFNSMQMLSNVRSDEFQPPCDSCCDYKYVVYYDSLKCSTCQMAHMAIWYKYLGVCKKNNVNISFVFIFSPTSSDVYNVINKYYSQKYSFHVYIDKNKAFEQNNKFICNHRGCRSIIIDSNNHIVFWGDPTVNKQEEDRFYRFINRFVIK